MRENPSTTITRSKARKTHPARPNFLLVGAAKSGTTALWHCLRQHPEIYMSPRKHTRFFSYGMDRMEVPGFRGPGPKNRDWGLLSYAVADPDDYRALFVGVTEETAIGEASHSYLYKPEAAGRIHEYDPDMILIAILRNPSERAFSHYSQMIREGREPLKDFVRALEKEEERVNTNWWPDFHYVQMGLYHAQLKRYMDLFGRDRIRVYLYEDFKLDPPGLLQDVFRFLGVDSTFASVAAIRYNASGIPKSGLLHTSLKELRRAKPFIERLVSERQYQALLRTGGGLHNRNLTKPRLSAETRKLVTDRYFREDISKLESLIRKDLSAWQE